MKRMLIICTLILVSISLGYFCLKKNKNNIDITQKKDYKKENNIGMIVRINNQNYDVFWENNDTVNGLIDILPIDLTMKDLNNNEKYVYLDKQLPSNPYYPKEIKKGDIMLYGSNCLVIFYKDFNSNYSYTKIGHINDLPEFDDEEIKVRLAPQE